MLGAVAIDIAKRHGFDQRQIESRDHAPSATRSGNLVLVHAFQRDHVDLNRKPRLLRGIDAGKNILQIASSG